MTTRLLIGGEWVDATGGFIPTYNPATEEVLAEVLGGDQRAKLVFGPVLAVFAHDHTEGLEPVINRANDTEYGLSATVWAHDMGLANRLADGMRAGASLINLPP